MESLAPAAREEASALKPLATRKLLRFVFIVSNAGIVSQVV
jgi:hypothetical protein